MRDRIMKLSSSELAYELTTYLLLNPQRGINSEDTVNLVLILFGPEISLEVSERLDADVNGRTLN